MKQIFVAALWAIPLLLAAPLARWMYPVQPTVAMAEGATFRTTTGYTVFQRQQVMPKYVYVVDDTGTMEYLNPGSVPGYPATFGAKLCYSTPFNLYSASSAERLEIWQDSSGTATVSEILAVCPQFTP